MRGDVHSKDDALKITNLLRDSMPGFAPAGRTWCPWHIPKAKLPMLTTALAG